METLLLRETGTDSLGPEQRFLMDHILENHEGYSLSFGMNIPIIGIGAPTGAWLPRVAEMLGTELVLPEHSSIGNAVGAITGYVSEIAEVSVRAVPMEPVEDPECEVYTGKAIRSFPNPAEALEFAQNEGIRMAVERAVRSGARDPEYVVTMELKEFQINPEKKVFRGANIQVRATGKPDLGTLNNIE